MYKHIQNKMKKSVSVIIPTYNGKELLMKYLPKCEHALQKSSLISDYEIIIVDDCSNDDTLTFLNKSYSHVIKLKNSSNSGFSKTINKGIRHSKMELALLLNNDIELPEDYFDKTIPFFNEQDHLFGISTEIRDIKGEKVLEGAKIALRKHGMLHYQDCLHKENCSTLYLCGGNALIDNQKLKELEGFNELFSPFYFEDFDLSLRAWRKGWTSLYTNQTFCKHCHSTTIFKENRKADVERVFLRNKILLNYLNNNTSNNIKMFSYLLSKLLLGYIAPTKSKMSYRNAIKDFAKLYKKAKVCRENEYFLLPPINEVTLK
jgi:GT2 family glycosyltransferase